jgi:hypothetical protein
VWDIYIVHLARNVPGIFVDMKKIMLSLLLLAAISSPAQQKLFQLYKDSANLIEDANKISFTFFSKVKLADASTGLAPTAEVNARSMRVYYSPESNTINLPLWSEATSPLKSFLYKMAGGDESEGKKIFGLFFNGFYIGNELGHAIQFAKEKGMNNKYQGEIFANTLAILFWRESGYKKQLEKCYSYVNNLLKVLPDPVPAGEYQEEYFQKNYDKIVLDPDQYGFFQFSQFKKIYEDQSLTSFSAFLQNYLRR